MPTTTTPVVVDCDNTMGLPRNEIDDGLAIMYLLGHPEIEIVAITTTWGNGSVDATTAQTRDLIARLGSRIPIHRGAAPPAAGAPARARWRARSEAAHALVHASREHEGRLVVLALGAASNLAGAAELDPDFFGRLRRIVVMGGYLGPLRFPKREVSELNLSCDPEASERVLHAPCPVTIMSAQLCLTARFGPRHILLHNRGPRWLRPLVREWYRTFSALTGVPGFYLWDLLPAAFLLEPRRFSPERYALHSRRDELVGGRLVLAPASVGGAANAGDAEPGIVHVPGTFERASAFVAEAARSWNTVARRSLTVHGSR